MHTGFLKTAVDIRRKWLVINPVHTNVNLFDGFLNLPRRGYDTRGF